MCDSLPHSHTNSLPLWWCSVCIVGNSLLKLSLPHSRLMVGFGLLHAASNFGTFSSRTNETNKVTSHDRGFRHHSWTKWEICKSQSPCWKSVLPQPRMSSASPVNAIPFSCHTNVIQPAKQSSMTHGLNTPGALLSPTQVLALATH